ncbi:autotransporter outer membrane beta-barrel domain-containing protein, partial [Escherichia coli]|nr:autotransporter outer membrane beta-barrel domain-containing protein [Escherichia coli]
SLDSFASGKLSGFDMGYSGIQFGGDKRLSDVMPLYVGLYIGSMDLPLYFQTPVIT